MMMISFQQTFAAPISMSRGGGYRLSDSPVSTGALNVRTCQNAEVVQSSGTLRKW